MKKAKKSLLTMISCAFLGSISLGVMHVQADATQIDESKFQMLLATSVRIGDGSKENPTGIRFTTIADEFKQDLQSVYPTYAYNYSWYTNLRLHLLEPTVAEDGFSAVYDETELTAKVAAQVWHSDGWNTLLLNLNQEQYFDILGTVFGSYIGAQSFVEVTDKATGEVVYSASTDSCASTAAYTASWALNSGKYEPNASDTAEEAAARAEARETLLAYTAPVIEDVSFTRDSATVWVGKSEFLTVKTQPARHGVIYSSSNEQVATVSPDGKVTGVSKGTATITATMGDKTDTCTVTVTDQAAEIVDFEDGTNPFMSGGNSNSIVSLDGNGKGNGTYSLKVRKNSQQEFILALNADYLKKTFAVERVKAISFDVYNFDSTYVFRQLTAYWKKTDGNNENKSEYVRWEKSETGYTVTIYREAYDKYMQTRYSTSEAMTLRVFLTYADDFYSSSWYSILTEFYIDDVRMHFADLEADFEDGKTSAYLTTNVAHSVVSIADSSMGRGEYALQAATDTNTLNVSISKAFLTQLFADTSKQYVQFRVYTDKDLSSAYATIHSVANSDYIEYRYQADGYYAVRIGRTAYENWAASNQAEMTITLTAKEALGTVYIDALEGKTDKALAPNGANVTYSERINPASGGAPNYDGYTDQFNPYAYSSIQSSEKIVDDIKIYYDAEYDKASLQVYKDAGYQVIMPQTNAQVSNNGTNPSTNVVSYQQLLNDAAEIGLKVLLTDGALWFMSEQTTLTNSYNYHLDYNGNTFDLNAPAPQNSKLYDNVKRQLGYYINHEAFYGIVLKDEPSVKVLQTGIYGCVYRTVKEVAKTVYGKDIYIHANQVGGVAYSNLDTYYPELTRQEYCDILGVALTSDLQSKTDSEFKSYVNGRVTGNIHESQQAEAYRNAIMKARYEKYLELFLDTTGADYLMPDLYPLYADVSTTYMLELQTAAQVAANRNVDLYVVSQTMSLVAKNSTNDRLLKEADLRWMNNTLLSFGVKNIVYYTYHTRGGNGGNELYYVDGSSPIQLNGEKARLWYSAQKIMAENQAFASTYMQFDHVKTGVYYSATSGYNVSYLQYLQSDKSYAKASVQTDGKALLVSELYDGENGNYMYAVFNAIDAKNKAIGTYQSATLTFSGEYNSVVVWRNGEKQFVSLDETNSVSVEIAAGEAVYLIPYYQKPDFIYDYENGDNGWFFPLNN